MTTPTRSAATPQADRLFERAQRHLPGGVSAAARINAAVATGLRVRVQAYGPRYSTLFGIDAEPRNYADVAGADRATERRFYAAALDEGVYLHHGWHHGISAVHDDAILDEALERLGRAARRTVEAA